MWLKLTIFYGNSDFMLLVYWLALEERSGHRSLEKGAAEFVHII